MNDQKKISVVIPVYQVEKYLDRCVQSVVSQTYQNLEIILVDDGSPDRCPDICDNWAEKDARILAIHKKNGGLSDARNAGLKKASGEYISFVDSDDYIAPEMLEKLLIALQTDGSDIACCAVEMIWEDETPSRLLTVRENRILDREEAQAALLRETLLKQPVWNRLYKSELISGIPFEVGKAHEDVFWSYQAIGNSARVSLIDYVGYYYTQRRESIMGEGYSLKRLDALEAVEKRYFYIRKEFPSLEQEAKLSILSNCIYHGQMAVRYLDASDRKKTFSTISRLIRKHGFSRSDFQNQKITHRMWFELSRFSLPLTCRLRNALNVGF